MNSKPLTKKPMIGVLATLICLTLSAQATTGNVEYVEGSGVIECDISTVSIDYNCGDDPNLHKVETGFLSSVSFRVEWDPVSIGAEELTVVMSGNPACAEETEEAPCDLVIRTGPSPLTISLDGAAASNMTISAQLYAGEPCEYGLILMDVPKECDVPPVRFVQDQPYNFTWILQRPLH